MSPRRPAPAVDRAIDLLDLLAAHPSESFLMSDLCRRVGINGASAHAVLGALERAGYVTRHPTNRTYSLGVGALVLGQAATRRHPAVAIATGEIEALSARLDVEGLLTVLAGDEIVYVATTGRPRPGSAEFRTGQRVPCVPPYGTVHLAWSTPSETEEWIQRSTTPLEGRQRDELLELLANVRTRGYAVGLDGGGIDSHVHQLSRALRESPTREALRDTMEELLTELRSQRYQLSTIEPQDRYDVGMVSAPAFDGLGRVTVALTLTGLPRGLTGVEVDRYGEAVMRSAMTVTRRTEGSPPIANPFQPV